MIESSRRILYVETAEDDTVGGSHKALFDLVRNLDDGRFEPVVLFYQDNEYVGRLEELGLETLSLEAERKAEVRTLEAAGPLRKGWEMLAMIGRRYRLLQDHRIDLVHLNNCPTIGCDDWLPAAKLARIPCVASCMGLSEPLDQPLRRLLVRQYDRVIPVSRHVEEVLVDAGLPRSLLTTIHHGVDLAGLRDAAGECSGDVREELGVPVGGTLVTMVGNLRRWKGQHVLLEALAEMDPGYREDLRVVFAGRAGDRYRDYQEQLQQIVREEDLDQVVAFLGFREDVPAILSAADIAVHASVDPEPGGITVLEAMTLGTPVIAAGQGGHTEALTEDCGIHFDPSRPGELASALQTLLKDPELRSELGAAAARRIEEFSLQRNVARTERLYEEILGVDDG